MKQTGTGPQGAPCFVKALSRFICSSRMFDLLFIMVVFCYAFFCVGTPNIFHLQKITFIIDRAFFLEHLGYPGGLCDYATAFATQFFYFPAVGAAVLSVLFLCFALAGAALADTLDSRLPRFWMHGYAAAVFLQVCGNPYFPYTLIVKMLLCTAACAAFVKLSAASARLRLVWGIVIGGGVYYCAGGFTLLIFCGSASLCEALYFKRSSLIMIPALACMAAAFPWIAAQSPLMIDLNDAWFQFLPDRYFQKFQGFSTLADISRGIYGLIAFPAVQIISSRVSQVFSNRARDAKRDETGKTDGRNRARNTRGIGRPARMRIVEAAAFALVAGQAFLSPPVTVGAKQQALMERYAGERRWLALLGLYNERPADSPALLPLVNRALYHTGLLLDNIFWYPQRFGADGLIRSYVSNQELMSQSDVYFDLGLAADARVLAFESQTLYENSPAVLVRLIETSLIARQLRAAELFVNVLDKNMLFKKQARRYRGYLADTARIALDYAEQINRLPKSDFPLSFSMPEMDLESLLENGNNKMAYEYLLAMNLLNNALDREISLLEKLGDYGFAGIPQSCEEALALGFLKEKTAPSAFAGVPVRQSTLDKCREFYAFSDTVPHTPWSVRHLYELFGNTYWFYRSFIMPPDTQKNPEEFAHDYVR